MVLDAVEETINKRKYNIENFLSEATSNATRSIDIFFFSLFFSKKLSLGCLVLTCPIISIINNLKLLPIQENFYHY